MKFAMFLGCNIPARLNQYESSARAVLSNLGVALVDIKEFNCCGYPVRNLDHNAFVFAAARNLALVAKENLNLITLCKCCFGSLKKAAYLIKENASLRAEINAALSKEGLHYDGDIEIQHFLSVLYHEVGLKELKKKITKPFADLMIAVHYGCHALRPSKIVQFDDPVSPTLFDQLVEITGAKSVEWSLKLDCCGAPLLGMNDALSMSLTEKKLADGKKVGADYICTACPYCQIQFDTVQNPIFTTREQNHQLPAILYPQLLGLSLGVEKKLLGLHLNQSPVQGLENFLAG